MTDDERLLELLARALDPGAVEPPTDRIASLRTQAAARRERLSDDAPAASEGRSAGAAPPPLPSPPEPVPLHRPGPVPSPTALPSRRVGWLAAGAAVAAAAVVVALIAVPALQRDRGRETSVASGSLSTTRDAVTRLRTALVSRDPLVVARADADLVRLAGQLPPDERALLQAEVVQVHVEAIQFLRAHPEVLAVVPTEPATGRPPPPPGGQRVTPLPTTAPTHLPPPTTVPTPVPTTAVAGPSVTITTVTPTVDGSFAVAFTVSGFTPDRSRRPGSYAVRFSFDGGHQPEVWDGPSPWTFPTDNAIRYQEVCAVVVDASRVEQAGSGNCVPIL